MSLKIGEVSKLFNISVEAWRFYASEKIIEPQRSSDSNYRISSTWDILQLMECIRYKNFGLSIKEISRLIHFEHLDFFIGHLRRQQHALMENMRYEQLLCAHVSECIDTLDTAPFNLGSFWFKRLPEQSYFTFLESHGDDYEDIIYDSKVFSSWSSNLHFLDTALFIPRGRLLSRASPKSDTWAYIIRKDYADALKLPVDESVVTIPSAVNLCTVVDLGERGNLDSALYESVFDYIDSHHLSIEGDFMGKVLVRFHEGGSYHRYMEIQIPVSQRSCS